MAADIAAVDTAVVDIVGGERKGAVPVAVGIAAVGIAAAELAAVGHRLAVPLVVGPDVRMTLYQPAEPCRNQDSGTRRK